MASDVNEPTASVLGRREHNNALQLGPRKKVYVADPSYPGKVTNLWLSSVVDPLVHHGRHFGRNIHALCSVHALLTNRFLRKVELAEQSEELFTAECI